jgi:hypothetical protein
MLKHGLARRFAFRILALPRVGQTTTRRLHAAGVDAAERRCLRFRGAVPITTMIRSAASFDVIGAILIMVLLPVMIAVLGPGS